MNTTVRASDALQRKSPVYVRNSRGIQQVTNLRRWGKELAGTLDDGRFVVIGRNRELLTTVGVKMIGGTR